MADEPRRDALPSKTLATSRDGAVLFAEIAAPPMNLLGPELVRDLVVAHPNPPRPTTPPRSWCSRAPTLTTSSRTST